VKKLNEKSETKEGEGKDESTEAKASASLTKEGNVKKA
jgi:hypothetical protein